MELKVAELPQLKQVLGQFLALDTQNIPTKLMFELVALDRYVTGKIDEVQKVIKKMEDDGGLTAFRKEVHAYIERHGIYNETSKDKVIAPGTQAFTQLNTMIAEFEEANKKVMDKIAEAHTQVIKFPAELKLTKKLLEQSSGISGRMLSTVFDFIK